MTRGEQVLPDDAQFDELSDFPSKACIEPVIARDTLALPGPEASNI